MPTAVTSLSTRVRVSMWLWAAGQADIDDPPGRLHQVEGQSRQVCGVGGVDHRVEGQVREGVLGPDVLEPEAAGEREGLLAATHQVHLGAGSAGEHSDQQPDRSRAEHQRPVAGREGRSLRRAQRVAARLDQRAEHGVDGVGKGV